MELPAPLRAALDHTHEGVKPAELAAATRELSRRYREADRDSPFLRSELEVLAYGAYRLPATYAAVRAVLLAVKDRLPEWHPESMLDLGAGPGTASWAGVETWPSMTDIELLERDERMAAFGQKLMSEAGDEPLAAARWRAVDLVEYRREWPRDLVIASYALGELDAGACRDLLERLWTDTSGVLTLVEPGTPAGFGVIRAARTLLIELGASVVAPCPHSQDCPMVGGDWCHFSQRLARSQAHRDAKDVTMGYEDEKYSYVAVTRMPISPLYGRIVRHPQIRPGHIRLQLCTPDGLRQRVVSKGNKQQFREARQARWGSPFGPEDGGHQPVPSSIDP